MRLLSAKTHSASLIACDLKGPTGPSGPGRTALKASYTQPRFSNLKDRAMNERFLSQTETAGQPTARLYSNALRRFLRSVPVARPLCVRSQNSLCVRSPKKDFAFGPKMALRSVPRKGHSAFGPKARTPACGPRSVFQKKNCVRSQKWSLCVRSQELPPPPHPPRAPPAPGAVAIVWRFFSGVGGGWTVRELAFGSRARKIQ